MHSRWLSVCLALALALVVLPAAATTHSISPGDNVQEAAQEALILAEPGDVVEFGEGTYEFTSSLSLDVDGITIRGAGMDKSILSFAGQDAGAEGLIITSDNVVCEDFAVENSKGDAIKAKGSNGISFIRVRTEWTNGPDETNGAYGLYPVECTDVLIDGCVAKAASDAGIYVGQSENIIVRNSRAELNVAGIEIENSWGADVYDNVATRNTGGILVFDLPGLPKQGGRDVRVFRNQIINNDTPNFAPAGNIVANVPTGTGLQIMANRNVEVFENVIKDNQSTNVSILSYFAGGNGEVKDEKYNPYPSKIHIHNNTIENGGHDPQGLVKSIVTPLLKGDIPDIIWDGIVAEGVDDPEIVITNNGDATFANLDLGNIGQPKKMNISRDLSAHKGSLPAIDAVVIEGI